MADNITLNEQTNTAGAILWTQELTGPKHAQIMKLADGSAGATTMIVAGNGSAADALRVTLANDGTGVLAQLGNISATVNVVVGAGTSNIGTVNDISKTVAVVVGAGSANIGSVNDISATVNVVVGAGTANIGTLNNISATVAVVTGSAFAVQESGSALSALETIAAVDFATQTTLATIDTDTGNIATNTTDLPNVIGTDGGAGPSKTLSVGGTESGGNIQEVRVDSDGHLQVDVLSGGGGGTEYTEDAAAAANPVGGALIGVRDDALATNTVSTDGDNIAARYAATGAAYVSPGNLLSTNNSTTSTLTSGNTYTGTADDCLGYSSVTIHLYANVASGTNGMTFQFCDENTFAQPDTYSYTMAADENRRFQFPVTARYFRVVYTNGGTGQTTFIVQTILHATSVSSSVHRLEDNVDSDRSSQLVKAAIVAQASGSGDFIPVAANASGKLQVAADVAGQAVSLSSSYTVVVATALPAGTNKIGNIGNISASVNVVIGSSSTLNGLGKIDGISATVSVDLGANNDVVATGNIAHDTADSGNPVKIGGKAKAFDGTAPGTDVSEDDRVDSIHTVDGRQFVEISHPNYWSASADYAAAQTNATVKAAAGAGLKLYITDVIVSNGATAGNITLLDGSGGTVLLELYPAINGGLTHAFRTPIALTANTLLAITSTTVTTHSVTVSGFIAA
jgi:hypothetical protein